MKCYRCSKTARGYLKNMRSIKDFYNKKARPEKVLCFGEGNFLRAFAAVVVQKLNENVGFDGDVVMLQGLEYGLADVINAQNGLYTVIERGVILGKALERNTTISCISRCIDPYSNYDEYIKLSGSPDLQVIVSNTTEFGINYDEREKSGQRTYNNFPAKLTDLLYRRYLHFSGGKDKGLVILPCELIESNGQKLKEYVLRYALEWGLGEGFTDWLETCNVFADTLVDRIVSGYPKEEASAICARLGYEDRLLDICEPFFLWVIQSDDESVRRLNLDKCGLDVVITRELAPYRTRKVRVLNGAHTMSALLGYMHGFTTVEEMVKSDTFRTYLRNGIYGEVIPSFHGAALREYAASVFERFENPYLKHKLLDISLNSVSKFRARILCSIKDYIKIYDKIPKNLSFSLAGLIAFYVAGADSFVRDETAIIDKFRSKDIGLILADEELWGEDLGTLHADIRGYVEKSYKVIVEFGAAKALEALNNGTL